MACSTYFRDTGTSDDYVGTFFLNVSHISAMGDSGILMMVNFDTSLTIITGFAPIFGPCFVNIYGSLREYDRYKDELNHLNKGLVSSSRE